MHAGEIDFFCTIGASSLSVNEWEARRVLGRVGDREIQSVYDWMEKVPILHT